MKNKTFSPITPRKNLGQNFLRDTNIVRKIIDACDLRLSDNVVEIGPGLGILTKEIAPRVSRLQAVEKDKRLAKQLQEDPLLGSASIINGDILGFDFARVAPPVKVIGNLPYSISSPIIEKLIENREYISEAFIMVQLEFGQRLVAQAGTKDYSALSCTSQYYARSEILFRIKNTAFFPIPKVESCFIRMRFKDVLDPCANDEKLFRHIVKTVFQQRRKKLMNSLAFLAPKTTLQEILHEACIDPSQRAENLSIGDYVRISNIAEKVDERKA